MHGSVCLMKANLVKVNLDVIKHYIEHADISLEALQAKSPRLKEILSESKEATFNDISDIAKELNIPTGLLLLEKPIDFGSRRPKFRTLNGDGVKLKDSLRDTILDMEEKQAFLRQEVENELPFIAQFSLNSSVDEVVQAIRHSLKLEENFMLSLKDTTEARKYLREKITSIGVFVFFNGVVGGDTHRPLDEKEFRGFVLSDKKAPIIFVNQRDSENARVFTLMHELVHLFIGEEEILTNEMADIVEANGYSFSKTEAFVNKITSEILAPKTVLTHLLEKENFFGTDDKLAVIDKIARKMKVSRSVIVRRLLTISIIDKPQFEEMNEALKERYLSPRRQGSGGDYKNKILFQIDRRFFSYVQQALMQRRISYTEAFKVIGVSYKGYKRLEEGHNG